MDEVIKETMARHMVWEPTGISTRSGFQTIDDLFVDDGVASRGHRLGWFLHIPLLYPCISPHDHCIC